jgi:hypothetical protein
MWLFLFYMADTVYIYTINCPESGLVRYVGKTIDPKHRFRKHLTENNRTLKSKWVKGLRSKGLKPTFEIIDECLDTDWEEKEVSYIQLFKASGAKLLNQARGGEGGATMLGRKLTPEQCEKISASKRGKERPGLADQNRKRLGVKVNQFNMSGELVATHESIRTAAIAVGRNYRRIQAMISGKGKAVNHVGGFRFEAKID